MKITKEIWSLGDLEQVREFRDIEHAVSDTTDDIREMFGRLLECMYGNERKPRHEALSHILGSNYEVEE